MQVFSRQAVQMDALISAFVDEIKQKAAMYSEDGDTLYSEGGAGGVAGPGQGTEPEVNIRIGSDRINIALLCIIYIAGVSGATNDGVPPRHPGELPEQQAEPPDAGHLR